MERAEEAERQIPAEIGGELLDPRIVSEPPAQLRIKRRTAVAEDGLSAKDLLAPGYLPA